MSLGGICKHRNRKDVVEEFNKLQQERRVQAYQAWFEELRSIMVNLNPHLSEAYFVSSFMSGLNEELRPMVKMLHPETMEQAAENARLQEIMIEAIMKKQRQHSKGANVGPAIPMVKGYGKELVRAKRDDSGCTW